jgi:hypothetical protein
VTGSRTRLNGLQFPLTVPRPRSGNRPAAFAPAAGGPAADRAGGYRREPVQGSRLSEQSSGYLNIYMNKRCSL